jgi:hypothetical protein
MGLIDSIKKVTGTIGDLMSKEAIVNPILMLALGFLSNLLVVAANEADGEEGKKMVRVAARTIMNMEWKLRAAVDASPTPFDNRVLDEFIEACREIEPGYVPVA